MLAHPWGRSDNSALMEEGLGRLQEHGLAGVEVDHQDHSPAQRAQLRALAGSLGLVMTGSSDFHGDGKVDHDLGCNTTAPEEFERLMELADAAREAAGRGTPDVMRPGAAAERR